MRRLVVVLVTVAVLLVLADRGGAFLAERLVAQRLEDRGAVAPEVDIHGVPFLTQLAGTHFDRVTVTAAALPLRQGVLRDAHAVLTDVEVSSPSRAVAGSLDGSGLVSFAAVEREAGLPAGSLSGRPNGVRLERSVDLLGTQVEVAATSRVTVDGDELLVTPVAVELVAGGALDASLTDLARRSLTFRVTVPELPSGLELEDVSVSRAGFRVRVSGHDVPLSGSGVPLS